MRLFHACLDRGGRTPAANQWSQCFIHAYKVPREMYSTPMRGRTGKPRFFNLQTYNKPARPGTCSVVASGMIFAVCALFVFGMLHVGASAFWLLYTLVTGHSTVCVCRGPTRVLATLRWFRSFPHWVSLLLRSLPIVDGVPTCTLWGLVCWHGVWHGARYTHHR